MKMLFRYMRRNLGFVILVLVRITEGVGFGRSCEKATDCNFVGSVCVFMSGCKIGSCSCNKNNYYAVTDPKSGITTCQETKLLNVGDTCGASNKERVCKSQSFCLRCPKGDNEENTFRCRSAGHLEAVTTPLLIISLVYCYLN